MSKTFFFDLFHSTLLHTEKKLLFLQEKPVSWDASLILFFFAGKTVLKKKLDFFLGFFYRKKLFLKNLQFFPVKTTGIFFVCSAQKKENKENELKKGCILKAILFKLSSSKTLIKHKLQKLN